MALDELTVDDLCLLIGLVGIEDNNRFSAYVNCEDGEAEILRLHERWSRAASLLDRLIDARKALTGSVR